jgi:phosphatidylinositol-3-phosphatase
MGSRLRTASIIGAAVLCVLYAVAPQTLRAAGGIPRPDHVVIVIEENHSFQEIYNSASAPYMNSLVPEAAVFNQSFAIEHPSEPNYFDLFSGANQGVTDDSCPHTFSTANLGAQLIAKGLTFGGYSEDLPSVGSTVCTSGFYARKHNPWVNFTNVPSGANMPFAGSWPTDFTKLPTISIVVPNLINDMHDGSVAQGDGWLQNNLDAYYKWAKLNNSLFIVTFDEDDRSANNQIFTMFAGPMVAPGLYSTHINHFNVLRTLEDMYGLAYAGAASTATPITNVWNTSVPSAPTLSASAGNARVTLTWGAVAGADTYTLYRGTTANGETVFKTGLTGTTFVDSQVTNGQIYYYRLSGSNANGEGPLSNEVSAKPKGGHRK